MLGIKGGCFFLTGDSAFHVDGNRSGPTLSQKIEGAGNGSRDAGAYEDIIHACEHGPIEGRQGGELDFFEVVDPHSTSMTFFGQKNLNEVGDNGQLHQFATWTQRGHGGEFETS